MTLFSKQVLPSTFLKGELRATLKLVEQDDAGLDATLLARIESADGDLKVSAMIPAGGSGRLPPGSWRTKPPEKDAVSSAPAYTGEHDGSYNYDKAPRQRAPRQECRPSCRRVYFTRRLTKSVVKVAETVGV